jgi:hypothetical protein
VLGKAPSSLEEISTTRNPSEGSSRSYIEDGSPQDETSSEESGGGEDLVAEGSSVEASLDEEKDPLT